MIQQFKKDWLRYIFEILVIIIGVTLSFIVNEWREAERQKKAEIVALEEILRDLRADSLAMNSELKQIMNFDTVFQVLLRPDLDIMQKKDSLEVGLAYFGSYSTFMPKQIGYRQLEQTGQLKIISNKTILNKLIELYTVDYKTIAEYNSIDKKYVLDTYIPLIMQKMSMPASGGFVKITRASLRETEKLLKSLAFRNAMIVNRRFKQIIVMYYRVTLVKISKMIKLVEADLHAKN